MRTVLLALAGAVTLLGAMPAPVCLPISGEHIMMRDFAPAIPEFAAAQSSAVVAYAPSPGARRVFSVAEARRLAARAHLELAAPTAVCFERRTEELSPDRVLAAMWQSLGIEGAHIEITELSRIPVPVGELVFPQELLSRSAGADGRPVLWRGYVRHGGNRRFPVWARVKVRVPLRRVVAARDLAIDTPINAGTVRLDVSEGFPEARQALHDVEQAVGRLPRRPIPAGSPVFPDSIMEPSAVSRGQTVEVTWESGVAKLSLLATAEAAGRIGDTIPVRNNDSRKVFSARITEKGRAAAIMGAKQ